MTQTKPASAALSLADPAHPVGNRPGFISDLWLSDSRQLGVVDTAASQRFNRVSPPPHPCCILCGEVFRLFLRPVCAYLACF